jgi:hypothetical protein
MTQIQNIRFQQLMHREVLATLLPPTQLARNMFSKYQCSYFNFNLTPKQVKNMRENPDVDVELRICLVTAGMSEEQQDAHPANLRVVLNSKICQVPAPELTQNFSFKCVPINLTPHLKMNKTVLSRNALIIYWDDVFGRDYAIKIDLVRKVTANDSVEKLKVSRVKSIESTKKMIREKFEGDSDVSTTALTASLICPLSRERIRVPCRASTCQHIQCLDALSYIKMNEVRAKWMCPVCNKPAPFESLELDQFFQEILASPLISPNDREIQLLRTGSWAKIAEKDSRKRVTIDLTSDSDNDQEGPSKKPCRWFQNWI